MISEPVDPNIGKKDFEYVLLKLTKTFPWHFQLLYAHTKDKDT